MANSKSGRPSDNAASALVRRGNEILRKYNIVAELNSLKIRREDDPRHYVDLAELSAALAIVERRSSEKAREVLGTSEDDVQWL